MRAAQTYRAARKAEARAQKRSWSSTPHRKIDIRRPTKDRPKGRALPLKAVIGGDPLQPSTEHAGHFVFDGASRRIRQLAIKRGGKVHAYDDCRSYRSLRQRMDAGNRLGVATQGDVPGFLTQDLEFVDIILGVKIGVEHGQLTKGEARELLASENWLGDLAIEGPAGSAE